jgi:hypothetical protein
MRTGRKCRMNAIFLELFQFNQWFGSNDILITAEKPLVIGHLLEL